MMEGERERLTRLESLLTERVIGQHEAVRAVSNAVRRSRAGLQDPNRPIGSFIFLGPTGVGKTETARALAEFLFDDEHATACFSMYSDMSMRSEEHTSELQSLAYLVCRLLLEKKKKKIYIA